MIYIIFKFQLWRIKRAKLRRVLREYSKLDENGYHPNYGKNYEINEIEEMMKTLPQEY